MPKISFDEQTSNGQQSNYFHTNPNCTNTDPNKTHQAGKTIKAVTRYIDAQANRQKAANLSKQQSQSMVNLSSNLSVEGDENLDSCSGDDRKQSTDSQQLNPNQNDQHHKYMNHANTAIRSIIESQYAILQQENEPSTKANLEIKKKKKQNKLKMNYLHQNNDDILMHGQISPRADCPTKSNCLFNLVGRQSSDSICKSDRKPSVNEEKISKLQNQHQKLVNNLEHEFKQTNKIEKAMNDYLNINTSNNTSNSSTNSTVGDIDLTAKVTATQEKLQQQESTETNNESNLERKSQFNCLPSRSTTTFQSDNITTLNQSEITISNQFRSLSIQAPDCPLERVQFYKWFSQIVRRGRKVGLQSGMDSKHFLNSNHTSKFGGFFELVYKQELRDLIWLEIKAWMDNRSMIEHDAYLCLQRKKIPKTLEKLMRFSVNYQHLNENNYQDKFSELNSELKQQHHPQQENNSLTTNGKCDLNDESKPTALVEQFKLNETKSLNRSSNENVTLSGTEVNDLKTFVDQDTLAASVALKLTMNDSANLDNQANKKPNSEKDYLGLNSPPILEDDNCNCSETLSTLCQYCVDRESCALEQINKVLNEIDEIEQLYPCVKALAIDYPLYESEQFVSRIKSLYLYQNIIRDVREKINLLAKLFHIHNREAAGWPNFRDQQNQSTEFSYNTSSDCTPEIFNITNRDNPTKSGYSYKLNAPAVATNTSYVKQVHFNLSAADDLKLQQQQANNQTACLDSPESQMHTIINLNGPHSAEDKTSNPFFPRKGRFMRMHFNCIFFRKLIYKKINRFLFLN